MGLFKKIKKAAKKVVKKATHPVSTVKSTAAKAIQNPARYTAAVLSGGTTELLRRAPVVGEKYSKIFDQAYEPLFMATADYYTYGLASRAQAGLTTKEGTVGFNLGGLLGATGQILGGVQGANAGGIRAAGAIATIASAAIKPTAPAMAMKPAMQAAGTALGMMAPAAGAAVAVGRKFFQKFPNLATAIQKFRNAGMTQVTRGRLYSMLKRFGPELLITGGILSAAAVNELMLAGPGTRRMNSANVKALRRSVRRIESFHNLCRKVDVLRSKGRGKACKSRSGGGTFVRQG